MSEWTTRLDPEITRQYGVEEVHDVWFEPPVWGEDRTIVGLLIPECEFQIVSMSSGEPVAMINRPQLNKGVKGWMRFACKMAVEQKAWISFGCDTHQDAELAARRAAKLLPKGYRRVALERMYEATSRESKNLS